MRGGAAGWRVAGWLGGGWLRRGTVPTRPAAGALVIRASADPHKGVDLVGLGLGLGW